MWDLHDLHRLQYFDHRDEGRLRGWRSLHITDRDHPYMKHWWVPGLQIGYEHTFIHQVADFLSAAGRRQERGADFPRGAAHGLCDGCGAGVRREPQLGQGSRIGEIGGHMLGRFAAIAIVSGAMFAQQSPAPAQVRRGCGSGTRADGAAAGGDRISADLRRQIAGRLGWRSGILAGGRRRAGGADDHGEAAGAEYISDLARRQSGGFRIEAAISS